MILIALDLISKGYRAICGLDEAGRGALAGPVVAAAVIFPTNLILHDAHRLSGIRDSKLLTPRQREDQYGRIMETALAVGVGMTSPSTIDTHNILESTRLAMQQAVGRLVQPPDFLLVDALALPAIPIPQRGIIHGDRLCVVIAAASIIAKVTRDRLMCQYHDEFPRYGFGQHKGYPTAAHLERIRALGPCQIHRRTFRGVRTEPAHHGNGGGESSRGVS